MIFIINRTSDRIGKPCPKAKKRSFPYWEQRNCSEEYFNKRFSKDEGLWKSKGKNHRTINKNNIERQEDDVELWSIEINTLEELIALEEKYGNLIITYENPNRNHRIEIYDSYRE